MELTRKKIVVTGGAGFVGSWVVKKLLERGVPPENVSVPLASECDLLTRAGAERAMRGAEVVIHLAGVTGGIEFHRQNPGRIFHDNLMIGLHTMEAAYRAGAQKFVGIGSATEYPAGAPVPYREDDLWLGYPEASHAPYSWAKRMLLVQGQAYRAQYGWNAIHLLPNSMFGPGEVPASGYVITSLVKRILEAKRDGTDHIQAWGTGRGEREFLYVEDAAEGIVLAAEKYDLAEPVNLSSGEITTIRDLAALIAELAEYSGEIRWDSSKPDGQLRRALDVSRAEREFGFRARTGLREGLIKTIAWYRKTIYK